MADTTQLQKLLDEQSYDQLVAVAANRLLLLTRKMLRAYPRLRRWEQTDDVFQTAVMRLHKSLSAVQPDSVAGFFGLATTQIRRTLIDLARHHFGPQGQAAKHETHHDSHPVTHDSPESLESWASFHEAVDRLPDQEQEVFQLLWYAGLPQQEVASLLGISVPTVQRRWYRSRHHLQIALSGDHPAMG